MNPYQSAGQPYADYQQQPPIVQHVHYHQSPAKSAGVAVALELLPGFFFQTFGIGNMYAGNVGIGLLFMFGYWFVLFVNIILCFVLIGLITLPLCWLIMMIVSPIVAASSATSRK